MKKEQTQRGFGIILHPDCVSGEPVRLVQESSAVGEHEKALEHPGSSFLWIGADHHLNREEVAMLVRELTYWLETGSLKGETK